MDGFDENARMLRIVVRYHAVPQVRDITSTWSRLEHRRRTPRDLLVGSHQDPWIQITLVSDCV